MKESMFWQQVSIRNQENSRIVRGGLSPAWAPVAALTGLHFWKIGMWLALIPALWLWMVHYEWLMKTARTLIWR